ncbi:pyocin activator PrtN family protein [Acinetobacter baumannii]
MFIRYTSEIEKAYQCDKPIKRRCFSNMLAGVRQNRFPFSCFRMDDSQKGTLFVDIRELAGVIDDIHRKQYTIFQNRTQKAIQQLN